LILLMHLPHRHLRYHVHEPLELFGHRKPAHSEGFVPDAVLCVREVGEDGCLVLRFPQMMGKLGIALAGCGTVAITRSPSTPLLQPGNV